MVIITVSDCSNSWSLSHTQRPSEPLSRAPLRSSGGNTHYTVVRRSCTRPVVCLLALLDRDWSTGTENAAWRARYIASCVSLATASHTSLSCRHAMLTLTPNLDNRQIIGLISAGDAFFPYSQAFCLLEYTFSFKNGFCIEHNLLVL